MSVLLAEMEAVLQGQKKVSAVSDKAQWWEGRKALDARVQVKDSGLISLTTFRGIIKLSLTNYFIHLRAVLFSYTVC